MYLASLTLINFRNYRRQELQFHPGVNIFCGKNGQGKTNFLEAAYYIAVSRSFRTGQDSEILRFGSDYFYLKGAFVTGEGRCIAETAYRQPHRLQIKINGKSLTRSEYIFRHPVVIFTPDDLFLVKEGPSVRRRFLDMECSRLKPLYYSRLRHYYRALRQRNSILKEKRGSRFTDFSVLEPWEQALAETGVWIIMERIKFLEELEEAAHSHFNSITAEDDTLTLRYRSTVCLAEDHALRESYYREQLHGARFKELRKGSTVLGPHLDDFAVMINDLDLRKYGSQGQQRTAVLSLKMGEVDLFNSTGDENSILLLDDVFSELDEERRSRLLKFLETRDDQSFITSAVPMADWDYKKKAYFFTVSGGEVKFERAGTGY